MKTNDSATYYIDEADAFASHTLCNRLLELMVNMGQLTKDLVFLCIGSDRVTGDSLGPMIGHQLCKSDLYGAYVYGTLNYPIHALNLAEMTHFIETAHPDALIIALDASLGSKKHLGYITLGQGSLLPGAGVRKALRPIGDIFITGIINTCGSMEHLTLQTTRLATVVKMADCISAGIISACRKHHEYKLYESQSLSVPQISFSQI